MSGLKPHGPGKMLSLRMRSQGKLENHLKVKIIGLGNRLAMEVQRMK